jgi:NAD(P)-dependent dehydrogenase (short-subunit alcohol dehydrogenase family)
VAEPIKVASLLQDKNVLITGASRRIGRAIAIAVAQNGGTVLLHYGKSREQAIRTAEELRKSGMKAHLLPADLSNAEQVIALIHRAFEHGPLYALINNASIFADLTLTNTNLDDWQRHQTINLTAPFLLSREFAVLKDSGDEGRIINLLDWRALRPGADHLPYTISKAGLVALTRSLALELAPSITVNGLALGAILPPSSGEASGDLLQLIPAKRWGTLEEVCEAVLFLLTGPSYITGEIIHIDGGRHLV